MNRKRIFRHRVNSISEIASLKEGWGAELDLRSDIRTPGKILITHDAWGVTEDFEMWLNAYLQRKNPGGLVLNTKEDGLEPRVLEILKQKKWSDFFFLDTTTPTLVKWTHVEKNPNFAVRLSAYEPPEYVQHFKGLAEWLWVDCFFGKPVPRAWVEAMSPYFKICLVSPELHGCSPDLITQFDETLGSLAHAVCTKKPELWRSFA